MHQLEYLRNLVDRQSSHSNHWLGAMWACFGMSASSGLTLAVLRFGTTAVSNNIWILFWVTCITFLGVGTSCIFGYRESRIARQRISDLILEYLRGPSTPGPRGDLLEARELRPKPTLVARLAGLLSQIRKAVY